MASFTNIKILNNIGLQKVCVDSSGQDKGNIYICDAEGILLKFNQECFLGEKKPTASEISDSTTATMAWNGDNICLGYSKIDFVAGSEKQVVGLIKEKKFDGEAIVDQLEFQLAVTTIDMNEENVVGGSSDYAVKCTSLSDPDAELKTRSLEAEPLCVKLDPRNEYVAISTVDGDVTILNLKTFSIVHTLKNIFKKFESIDVSKPLIQISWSKDGKWLFVPCKEGVKSFRRNGWEDAGMYRLKETEHSEFSLTAVSQCGEFLGASTMDNHVAIWKIDDMKLVGTQVLTRMTPGNTVITSIEFSPFSPNQLVIADSNKGVCLFNAVSSSSSFAHDKMEEDIKTADSDDDDSLLLSRTTKKDLLDEEAMDQDDEDTRMSSDLGAIKKQFGYGDTDLGGLEEFGFRVGEPDELHRVSPGDQKAPQVVYTEAPPPKKVLIPEQFACSSSALTDGEISQRYLKYNRFGIVRTYVNEASKVSNIDIEFHDKTIHRDINIDNFEFNFELADISTEIVALASLESRRKEKEIDKATDEIEDLNTDLSEKEEKKGTSVLHVIPIASFGNQPWSMTMPRGDGVVDVLVSRRMVVVLTKKRHVRVFTIGGVQRQIFTHPTPILTATCFEDRIAIASVSGSEFYENKKTPQWRFEMTEYALNQRTWYRDVNTRSCSGASTKMEVPVESGEQLEWIGYSAQGKLAVMDSAYNVHVLSAPGLWIPVFQGSSVLRGPSDSIFPLAITTKEFRYIYCRGSRSPLVAGINAPTTVVWKLPFCQPDSARTDMEHSLFLNELQLADAILDKDNEKISDETKKLTSTIVKLFAFLAKTNADGLAAEVAALVTGGTTTRTIQSLCNYASKCKKVALADKVAEIGRRMGEGDLEDRRDEEDVIRPQKHIAFSRRKVKSTTPPVQEVQERFDGEDDDHENEHERTQLNMDMDTSISTQPIRQIEKKTAGNPFAKGGSQPDSSEGSLSIFDQLETTDRKRAAEPVSGSITQPTARKQAKLNFGGVAKKKTAAPQADKENHEEEKTREEDVEPVKKSTSPYELWLAESKSILQSEFEGEPADFTKFCIQSFRALTKEKKDEWKAKAAAVN